MQNADASRIPRLVGIGLVNLWLTRLTYLMLEKNTMDYHCAPSVRQHIIRTEQRPDFITNGTGSSRKVRESKEHYKEVLKRFNEYKEEKK